MSAIAQPVSGTAAKAERKPSGWDHLKTLLPYVGRYRKMVALGLVSLLLVGLAAFLWSLSCGQFEDLEGAGWRVLQDDETGARPTRRDR